MASSSEETISEVILNQAASRPDDACIVLWSGTDDRIAEVLTFADFAARALRVSAQLKTSLYPGDGVAILSGPTCGYFVAAAGVLLAGGFVVNGARCARETKLAEPSS